LQNLLLQAPPEASLSVGSRRIQRIQRQITAAEEFIANLPPVSFDVIKINQMGRRQRRVVHVTSSHILNAKVIRKRNSAASSHFSKRKSSKIAGNKGEATPAAAPLVHGDLPLKVTKAHHFDDVRNVTLKSHDTLLIQYHNDHDFTYKSPVATSILHEIGTRIAVSLATKKKKVQLSIAKSLNKRRSARKRSLHSRGTSSSSNRSLQSKKGHSAANSLTLSGLLEEADEDEDEEVDEEGKKGEMADAERNVGVGGSGSGGDVREGGEGGEGGGGLGAVFEENFNRKEEYLEKSDPEINAVVDVIGNTDGGVDDEAGDSAKAQGDGAAVDDGAEVDDGAATGDPTKFTASATEENSTTPRTDLLRETQHASSDSVSSVVSTSSVYSEVGPLPSSTGLGLDLRGPSDTPGLDSFGGGRRKLGIGNKRGSNIARAGPSRRASKLARLTGETEEQRLEGVLRKIIFDPSSDVGATRMHFLTTFKDVCTAKSPADAMKHLRFFVDGMQKYIMETHCSSKEKSVLGRLLVDVSFTDDHLDKRSNTSLVLEGRSSG
jgi:hypothetical protein